MNANALPSERVAVAGVIDPDVTAAGAVSTDYIDMRKFGSALAIVLAGTMEATSTLDAKLQQAQDAGGTGVKDITGKAITQLTAAGTDSDKQALINLRAEDLDGDNGFTHARLTITVAVADSDAGGLILGLDPRHAPASDNDLASVDEIVT